MVAAANMEPRRPALREMGYEDYEAIDAVRASDLKALGKSPRRYLWTQTHRTDSATLRLGRAVHTAVLEPEKYAVEYAVATMRRDARTSEYKAFLASHPGACVLSPDEDREARETAAAVHEHPEAHALLTGGVAERVIIFDGPHGLMLKVRPDYIRLRPGALVDLKSTRNVKPRRFMSQAWDLEYMTQLALYQEAVLRATGHVLPVYIVACEAKDEHDVGVFECPPVWLEAGGDLVRQRLDLLAECRASGRWPGQVPEIVTMEAPRWAEFEARGEGEE